MHDPVKEELLESLLQLLGAMEKVGDYYAPRAMHRAREAVKLSTEERETSER